METKTTGEIQLTIRLILDKATKLFPTVQKLYNFWQENDCEKLDIVEEFSYLLQLIGQLSNSTKEEKTVQWNFKKPTRLISMDASMPKDMDPLFVPKTILGDRRVRRDEIKPQNNPTARITSSPTETTDPTNEIDEERVRLRSFLEKQRFSRKDYPKLYTMPQLPDWDSKSSTNGVLYSSSPVPEPLEVNQIIDPINYQPIDSIPKARRTRSRIKEVLGQSGVAISVYKNDITFKTIHLEPWHTKNDLLSMSLKAFNLQASTVTYTISLWENFTEHREIREASLFKPYYENVIAVDPTRIMIHLHRVTPNKKATEETANDVDLGPDMEDWKSPEVIEKPRYKKPETKTVSPAEKSMQKTNNAIVANVSNSPIHATRLNTTSFKLKSITPLTHITAPIELVDKKTKDKPLTSRTSKVLQFSNSKPQLRPFNNQNLKNSKSPSNSEVDTSSSSTKHQQ